MLFITNKMIQKLKYSFPQCFLAKTIKNGKVILPTGCILRKDPNGQWMMYYNSDNGYDAISVLECAGIIITLKKLKDATEIYLRRVVNKELEEQRLVEKMRYRFHPLMASMLAACDNHGKQFIEIARDCEFSRVNATKYFHCKLMSKFGKKVRCDMDNCPMMGVKEYKVVRRTILYG